MIETLIIIELVLIGIYLINQQKGKIMTIDIGNKCVACLKDTSFGAGRFVNRIPAENDEYEGYLCGDCVHEFEQEMDSIINA